MWKLKVHIAALLLINSSHLIGITDSRVFITNIASEFIDSYKELEGIELVFGDGGLEDYCSKEMGYVDSDEQQHYLVDYVYDTKIDGIRGFPHFFAIDLCEGISSNFIYTKEDYYDLSEIDVKDFKEISLTKIPRIRLEPFMPDDVWTIIQISGEKIYRRNQDISCIANISEIEDDIFYVSYNDTYQSHFFNELIKTNIGVRLEYNKNGEWETKYKSILEKRKNIEDMNFILYGNLSDQRLLSLKKAYNSINPCIKILAIQVIDDDTVIVYNGDFDAVTKWLKRKISAIVVIQKKQQDWVVVNTANIINVSNQCLNLPIFFFPIHDDPSCEQIKYIMKELDIESDSRQEEVREILNYAIRLRGVGKNIQNIKWKDTNVVEVRTESYPYQQLLEFTKYDSFWRITKYLNF